MVERIAHVGRRMTRKRKQATDENGAEQTPPTLSSAVAHDERRMGARGEREQTGGEESRSSADHAGRAGVMSGRRQTWSLHRNHLNND